MANKFDRFEEFRSIIDSTEDKEMMNNCLALLRDLIKINDLEQTIENIRNDLYKDTKRHIFSFFVEGLSAEKIASLADKTSGRIKFLSAKEEKANEQKAKAEEALKQKAESEKSDQNKGESEPQEG